MSEEHPQMKKVGENTPTKVNGMTQEEFYARLENEYSITKEKIAELQEKVNAIDKATPATMLDAMKLYFEAEFNRTELIFLAIDSKSRGNFFANKLQELEVALGVEKEKVSYLIAEQTQAKQAVKEPTQD